MLYPSVFQRYSISCDSVSSAIPGKIQEKSFNLTPSGVNHWFFILHLHLSRLTNLRYLWTLSLLLWTGIVMTWMWIWRSEKKSGLRMQIWSSWTHREYSINIFVESINPLSHGSGGVIEEWLIKRKENKRHWGKIQYGQKKP